MGKGVGFRVDLTGKRFGRLVVLSFVGKADGKKNPKWLCQCDCGVEKAVYGHSLRTKNTTSCGCWKTESCAARLRKHGLTTSREYSIHQGMLRRCYSTKDRIYKWYGARGIAVCDRWRGPDGFTNFLADMGPRPSPGHSIDRINGDGPYSPENCRWATRHEQSRNRHDNHFITHKGQTKCLKDWAKEYGVTQSALSWRVNTGWDIERALGTPVSPSRRLLTLHGRTMSMAEWAREVGISEEVICHRLKHLGWSVEDALTRPVRQLSRTHTFKGESLTLSQWAARTGLSYHVIWSRLRIGWTLEKALTTQLER